jgi:hypothetical protein
MNEISSMDYPQHGEKFYFLLGLYLYSKSVDSGVNRDVSQQTVSKTILKTFYKKRYKIASRPASRHHLLML